MRTTSAVRVADVERERAVAAYTWLTPTEAGERAGGVSAATIRAHIRSERLRALNVGTATRPDYRIKPEWVDEFMATRTTGPGPNA